MQSRRFAKALTALLLASGCTTATEQRAAKESSTQTQAPSTTTTAAEVPTPTTTQPTPTTTAAADPAWVVGATPLPLRPDGFGKILPTPAVLADRALPTKDLLPPPQNNAYAATVSAIPDDVLARSTWQPQCPVARADLRYLTMSFWGFDGKPHTGEMIVNARTAHQITDVFRSLFTARFPLEEMRVTARAELDAHPTGDGNNTTAFVCRPGVNLKTWSAHAYGLAIDLNPFCNPYIKGNLVLPELSSSYVDRRNVRAGMVFAGDVVVRAFSAAGWSWGGEWTSPVDIQHFTATGR